MSQIPTTTTGSAVGTKNEGETCDKIDEGSNEGVETFLSAKYFRTIQ
jgi:hypothetical protein